MITQNRGRVLWMLSGLSAAVAVGNVIIFYTTDGFGPPWFAVTLIVYGLVVAASVTLALIEPSDARPAEPSRPQEAAAAPPRSEASAPSSRVKILERTVFETASGKLVRLESEENGVVTMEHILVTPKGSFPVERLEHRLGGLPVIPGPRNLEGDAEAYLAKADVPSPSRRAEPREAIQPVPSRVQATIRRAVPLSAEAVE